MHESVIKFQWAFEGYLQIIQREDLKAWIYDAVVANGGEASIVEVARHIWEYHERDIKTAGDLLYTWLYDMRWAATLLRKEGRMAGAGATARGVWILKR